MLFRFKRGFVVCTAASIDLPPLNKATISFVVSQDPKSLGGISANSIRAVQLDSLVFVRSDRDSNTHRRRAGRWTAVGALLLNFLMTSCKAVIA